jgi:hypothetical protein
MSTDSFWPKTWREAIPLIVWGILIFAAGFEGIATLVHAEWLSSLASFALMVGLTAMLLHWKSWLAAVNPNWLAGAVTVVLAAIILSPFIEQGRWPFSVWFQSGSPSATHDPPTAEDIAKATAPIRVERDKAISDLATATKDRDDLKRENDALRQSASRQTAPQSPQGSLSDAEDIATKIGIWQSVDQQINDLTKVLNEGYATLDTWLPDFQSNRSEEIMRVGALEVAAADFRAKLETLRTSYFNYADIAEALKETAISPGSPPIPGSTFDRLLRSIHGFAQQLRSFGDTPPHNLKNITPHVDALRRDLNAVKRWQSEIRQTAEDQGKKLYKIESK